MPLTNRGKQVCLQSGLLSTSRWLSLHTEQPPAGELSGGGYSRLHLPATAHSVSSTGLMRNIVALSWATPTQQWPEPQYVSLYTAATGGELLMWADLGGVNYTDIRPANPLPAIPVNGLAFNFFGDT